MPNETYDLILLGGGHAHCAVLADWIKHGVPAERAALVTPHRFLRYSGMVPGWIAGQYGAEEGRVDLRALAAKAGVQFIEDRCSAIDADARLLTVSGGQKILFQFCSIDTGGVGRAAKIFGDDPRLVDVRPIEGLTRRLAGVIEAQNIAIIGGGAGGVELGFAMRNHRDAPRTVTLIAGKAGLLPDFARGPRELVRRALEAQDIAIIEVDVERADDGLKIAGGAQTAADDPLQSAQIVVAAIGSGAPDWPRAGGLAVEADGFIAVDRFQRSTSHPNIYAAGDVAARQDRTVPHSGVHSVHAGPVLAANLRAALAGGEPSRSYTPRPASLYILSTANGSAIAIYGPIATEAEWVSDLKAWIDKKWIASYAKLTRG